MRKIFVMTLTALALVAFVSAPVFAQCAASGNKGVKSAQNAAAVDAKLVSSKNINDFTYKCNVPCEGHEGYEGKCALVDMSIKGMTCGGCENTIKTALEKIPGVLKVQSISHKEGMAKVCLDPDKANMETMTKAVVDNGYEAQIIPAVAKTGDVKGEVKAASAKAGCNMPCPSKASCASKCGGAKKASAEATTKTSGDGTK